MPGYVQVVGAATATATSVTATVNGQQEAVDYRRGEYFQEERAVANSTPQWLAITASATLGTTVSTPSTANNVFLAATPENLTYDEDGNLKIDARWTYTWDAENRLKEVVANSNVPDGAKRKVQFTYDHMGRRASKTVYSYSGGSYINPVTTRYVYDGWRVVAELDASNNVLRSYGWGLDLSGSMEGAGGIGGLWAVKVHGGSPSDNFVAYDGNGNVTALVDGSTQVASARYEYGPFGELVRSSGTLAKVNSFRFSTKWQDDETELIYYGYRYYSPILGRWLNRDQTAEDGGKNVYAFVENGTLGFIDRLGAAKVKYDGGHHVVTAEIIRLLDEGPAAGLFNANQIPKNSSHKWNGPNGPHGQYNTAVMSMFKDFLQRHGMKIDSPADMARFSRSSEMAQLFLNEVLINPKTGGYLNSIRSGSGVINSGRRAAKMALMIGAAAAYSAGQVTGVAGQVMSLIQSPELANQLVGNMQSYARAVESGDDAMVTLEAVETTLTLQQIEGDYFTTMWALDMLLQ